MVRKCPSLRSFFLMSTLITRHRGFVVALRRSGSCAFIESSCRHHKRCHYYASATAKNGDQWRQFSVKRSNADAGRSLLQSNQEIPEKALQDSDSRNRTKKDTINERVSVNAGWRKRLRRRAGGVLSAAGFVASSTKSLVTNRKDQQWKPIVDALRSFLVQSGIDLELAAVLNVRLLDSIMLLSRIEKAALNGRDRRDLALLPKRAAAAFKSPTNKEALRFIKYATAAYGIVMIRAAEVDALGKFDSPLGSMTRTRISEHCSIPENDIVYLDTDYDGDTKHLRHFVAYDHENETVVLAIRGTYALPEIVTDAAGFSRPFCGGEAHSAMATMAERVWDASGSIILQMLDENPTYEFVITGHSLGAGTATLLNIMCHQNRRALVRGRMVRCFAFASPPTFTPLETVPEAVKSCTNYIHERDVVPFLSVDAIRHLFNCVSVIEEQALSWTKRMQLITGYKEPDEELIHAVRIASRNRLVTKPGAPLLVIPSAGNIWISENDLVKDYDTKICDSIALAKLGVLLDAKMLDDHFPSRYEHAFHNLDEL